VSGKPEGYSRAGGGHGLGSRPSPDAIARRRDWIEKQDKSGQGYWEFQLSRALSVSGSTINADRHWLRSHGRLRGIKRVGGKNPVPPDPEPYDWVSEPEITLGSYGTGPLPRLKALLEYLRVSGARNRWAHDVADMIKAGDDETFLQAQVTLRDLAGYVEEFEAILHDADARREAVTGTREDLTGEAGLQNFKTLPPRGSGEIASRIHACAWQGLHAGWPDDKIIDRVVRQQRVSRARAARALQELREDGDRRLREILAGLSRQDAG
jgi:hypothetical protein